MTSDFIQEQIDNTKAQIILYQDAIEAIVTNGAEQYKLDTGQSAQSVTKLDIDKLQKHLDSLYNRLSTLCARLNGSGTVTARPGF